MRATYEISQGHSWQCTTPNGYGIDLHWWAFKPAGDDSSMFETARIADLLGRKVLVPSPTENLLVTVANAFWIYGTPMRWIADSLLILRTGTIEWDTVLQRADRPGLLPGLSVGLAYLAREFDAPGPLRYCTSCPEGESVGGHVAPTGRRQPATWLSWRN